MILDCEAIGVYDGQDLYPMRGESCFTYFRECNYLGLCQMDTEKLVSPLTSEQEQAVVDKNHTDYEIKLTLSDLITSQLSKVS